MKITPKMIAAIFTLLFQFVIETLNSDHKISGTTFIISTGIAFTAMFILLIMSEKDTQKADKKIEELKIKAIEHEKKFNDKETELTKDKKELTEFMFGEFKTDDSHEHN